VTRWSALILAGSRGPTDPVARAAGVAQKAFAPVAGRPMIEHVIDALRAVPEIGDIAASIPPEAPSLPAGVLRLDAGPGPSASALDAFDRLGPPLLVTAADHPLLTAAMVADLLAAAGKSGSDAVAGVCPRASADAAGNPGPRTWIGFSDGAVSGANLFALATPRARGALVLWRRLEAERKRPWRIAWRIGPATLWRYLASRLDSAAAARALGRAADCSAAFAVIHHPDAAHDVDSAEDMAFAEMRLRARAAHRTETRRGSRPSGRSA
jgi:GTP:adenosylcobinamide-phosphate guanylyltransferase